MQSIIFRYINEKGRTVTAIGSYKFYKNKAKTCRQIIATLGLEHNEETWEYMVEKSESELLDTLEAMLRDNSLYVENLN